MTKTTNCKPDCETEAKRERLWSAIERARIETERGLDPAAELRLVTAWNALAAFNRDNG